MIPVYSPHVGQEEILLVNSCLSSGWISSAGSYIEEFETSWAGYVGCKHGVAVTNGTHALELALAACDLPPQSEVIIPSFTIISCALAAIKNNLKPVLCDVDPITWCIDTNKIIDKITDNTSAIMPVHMYGHSADMSKILSIAKLNCLKVIEDAAEAHGAEYLYNDGWRRCGGMGDVGCFSFYGNKIITTGEGGMVVTNDENIAKKMRSIRNLCFGEGYNRFIHTGIGSNFRMTNIQAAIGLGQIKRIDQILNNKRRVADYYNHHLSKHQELQLPPNTDDVRNVYWMYGIVSKNKQLKAVDIIKRLKAKDIESRPFFAGLHKQPIGVTGIFPITDYISEYGLYIPSGIDLTEQQLEYVCSSIKEILQ